MGERSFLEHVVRPGECLASLAAKLRATVDEIWELDENAELREQRQDPYVLVPGDRVMVPAPSTEAVRVIAGQRHVFQVHSSYADFQVRVDRNGKPRANAAFKLVIDGGAFEVEGVSDNDGVVRARIPASARRGVVEFTDGRGKVVFELGTLEPWDTLRGVQGRLRDLGYYLGDVDGIHGPRTARALRRFQKEQGLEVTGKADDSTKLALRSKFGR